MNDTSILSIYSVKSIATEDCKEWLLYKHYAKRLCPIEFAFGLFNDKNIMQGILTVGTPVSNTLRNLWNNEYKLMELNRLVVNENLPKNTLSFFVMSAIKMLPKPLVLVSYADTSKNHHGYIYQATNWIYTGLSAKFNDYYVKGMEHLHNGTIMDMSRGKENRVEWLRQKFGDDLIMIERDRKHRYFMFLGNKRDKVKMLKMLPYKIEKYPKGQNIRYDSSYKTVSQLSIF
jgi:hypothetical protein